MVGRSDIAPTANDSLVDPKAIEVEQLEAELAELRRVRNQKLQEWNKYDEQAVAKINAAQKKLANLSDGFEELQGGCTLDRHGEWHTNAGIQKKKDEKKTLKLIPFRQSDAKNPRNPHNHEPPSLRRVAQPKPTTPPLP